MSTLPRASTDGRALSNANNIRKRLGGDPGRCGGRTAFYFVLEIGQSAPAGGYGGATACLQQGCGSPRRPDRCAEYPGRRLSISRATETHNLHYRMRFTPIYCTRRSLGRPGLGLGGALAPDLGDADGGCSRLDAH